MPRTYLDIPYLKNTDARDMCRRAGAPGIIWDGARKQMYWPGSHPPKALTDHFKVIETIPTSDPEPKYREIPFVLTPERKTPSSQPVPGGPDNLLIGHAFAGTTNITTLRSTPVIRPVPTRSSFTSHLTGTQPSRPKPISRQNVTCKNDPRACMQLAKIRP